MSKVLTNEEFLQKLKDLNIKYIPLEEYKGSKVKIKWLCYKDTTHIFMAKPEKIYIGYGCAICSGHQILRGVNDLWTTRPDVATMLLNKEEGYLYTSGSKHITDWKCPDCGNIVKSKSISEASQYGIRCRVCSDGMSYSEKFMFEFFSQLNLNFIYDRTQPWSNNKRYDFYLPDYNMIVETHGEQHYRQRFIFKNNNKMSKSLKEEMMNDKFKEELAIDNGIKYYITLNCSVSDLEFIKSSILNSGLNKMFDLSIIDWNKCHAFTSESITLYICNLWNNGMKNTTKICEYTGFSLNTVLRKLKLGTEIGLCNYVKNSQKTRNFTKPVECIETGKVYEKLEYVKEDGYEPSNISLCCNGKRNRETAYGYHWRFI